MQKTQFSEQPDRIFYLPLSNGSAEVALRRNIVETEDSEGHPMWEADEVKFISHLSRSEIEAQFDSYFLEEPETTIEDLKEALQILTEIILEG